MDIDYNIDKLDIFIIKNIKTELFKMIYSSDFNKFELQDIIEFYNNHDQYTIYKYGEK